VVLWVMGLKNAVQAGEDLGVYERCGSPIYECLRERCAILAVGGR